jgi:ankyrin repeat protein
MTISALLEQIKAIPFEGSIAVPPRLTDIHNAIARIVAICNAKYSNQSFYGNAALNRLMLLDDEIAPLLSADVLHYLFSQEPTAKEKIYRNSTGLINLRDAIFFGFSDGLAIIEYLPNNEKEYSPEHYRLQKEKYKKNVLRIVENIQVVAQHQHQEPALDVTILLQPLFTSMLQLIDRIVELDGEATLLHVPGYSSKQIKDQVKGGFLAASKILGKDNLQEVTLDDWIQSFLTDEKALLHGDVIHLFYDRAHLLCALTQKTEIRFKDGVFLYRDLFQAMLKKLAENTDVPQYQVAREQLTLRMSLVSSDLETRPQLAIFRDAAKSVMLTDETISHMVDSLVREYLDTSLPEAVRREKSITIGQIIVSCAEGCTPTHITRLRYFIKHPYLSRMHFADAGPGNYMLCHAALAGNLEGVKLLLTVPIIQSNVDYDLNDALLYAAQGGNLDIIKLLLNFSKVEAAVDIRECSALRYALYNKHHDVAQHLLQYNSVYAYATLHHQRLGFDVDEYVHQQKAELLGLTESRWDEATCLRAGYTLSYLITKGREEDLQDIARLFRVKSFMASIEGQNPNNLLTAASRSGNIFIVNELLKNPQIAMRAGTRYNTVLMGAAAQGKVEIVRRLMREPAIIEAADGPDFILNLVKYIKDKPQVTACLLENPFLFNLIEKQCSDFESDIEAHAKRLVQNIQEDMVSFASAYPEGRYAMPQDLCDSLLVLLRHLIRKNDPKDLDTIEFILSLKAIQEHITSPVYSNKENCLIRQAIKMGNPVVIKKFMEFSQVRTSLEEELHIPYSDMASQYYLAYARQPEVFNELTLLGFNLNNKDHLAVFNRFCLLAEQQSDFLILDVLVPILRERLGQLNPDQMKALFLRDKVFIINRLLSLDVKKGSAQEKTLYSIIEMGKKSSQLIQGPNPKAETTVLLEELASSLTKALIPQSSQVDNNQLPQVRMNQFYEIEFVLREPLLGYKIINLSELINHCELEHLVLQEETIATLGQLLHALVRNLDMCKTTFTQPKSELFKRLPNAINLAFHYYTMDEFYTNANRMFRGASMAGAALKPSHIIVYFLMNTLIAVGLNRLTQLIYDEEVYKAEKAVIQKLRAVGDVYQLVRSNEEYERFVRMAHIKEIISPEEYELLHGRFDEMQPLLGSYPVAIRGADMPRTLIRQQLSQGKTTLPAFTSATVGKSLTTFFQVRDTHIGFSGMRPTAILTHHATHDIEKEIMFFGKALVGYNYLKKGMLMMQFYSEVSPKSLLDYATMMLNRQLARSSGAMRRGMREVYLGPPLTASQGSTDRPTTEVLDKSRNGQGVPVDIRFRPPRNESMFWITGKKQWIPSLCADLFEQPYPDEPFNYVQSSTSGLMAWHVEFGSLHALRLFVLTPVLLSLFQKYAASPYKEALKDFNVEEVACLALAMFLYDSGRTNTQTTAKDSSNIKRSALVFGAIARDLGFQSNLINQIQHLIALNIKLEEVFTKDPSGKVTQTKLLLKTPEGFWGLPQNAFAGDITTQINKARICYLIMSAATQIEYVHLYSDGLEAVADYTFSQIIINPYKREQLIKNMLSYSSALCVAVGDGVAYKFARHDYEVDRLVSMVNQPILAYEAMQAVELPELCPPLERIVLPKNEIPQATPLSDPFLSPLLSPLSFESFSHFLPIAGHESLLKHDHPYVLRLQSYAPIVIEYLKDHCVNQEVLSLLEDGMDLSMINVLCAWDGGHSLSLLFSACGMPIPAFLQTNEGHFRQVLFTMKSPSEAIKLLETESIVDLKIQCMALVISLAKTIDKVTTLNPDEISLALKPFEMFVSASIEQEHDLREIVRYAVKLIHVQGEECACEIEQDGLRGKKTPRQMQYSVLERHPQLLYLVTDGIEKPTVQGPQIKASLDL